MTVRVGETGKSIYLIVSFDTVAATSLAIKAKAPSGAVKTWSATSGGALTNITTEDGTTVASVAVYESIFYTLTNTTDIDEAGDWVLVPLYTNTGTNPDTYLVGDPATLTVLEDNFSS